jgi:hypothetical protein
MNSDFVNGLQVVAYMLLGTVAIVVLLAWLLKRAGPPRK